MQYFGGKVLVSKDLCNFINSEIKENQPFVDLFCGSCNIVSGIEPNRDRIANDKHYYLIEMWKKVQSGWDIPINITKEDYYSIKENGKDYEKGFYGFACSFAGKWWGGWAKSEKQPKNYAELSKNSTLRKINSMKNVKFINKDYYDVELPNNSFIYCDIPYKNSTPYCKKEVGDFDHDKFYNFVKEKSAEGHKIFVSEYLKNVPSGFDIVWTKNSKKIIRDSNDENADTVEVLFTYNCK